MRHIRKILFMFVFCLITSSMLFAIDLSKMYQKAEDAIIKGSNPTKAMRLYDEFKKESDAYFAEAEEKAMELTRKANSTGDSKYIEQYYELMGEANGIAASISNGGEVSQEAISKFLGIAKTSSDKAIANEIYAWLYDNTSYRPKLTIDPNGLPSDKYRYTSTKELTCRPGESVVLPAEDGIGFILLGYGKTKDKVDFAPGTEIELPVDFTDLYAIWKNVYTFYDPVSDQTTTIEAFPGEEISLPKATSSGAFRFVGWEEVKENSYWGTSVLPATQKTMISATTDRYHFRNDIAFSYTAIYDNATLAAYALTDLGENADNIVSTGEDVGILPIYHNYGDADMVTESTIILSSDSEYVDIKVGELKIGQLKGQDDYFVIPGGRQNMFDSDYASTADKFLRNVNSKAFKSRKNAFFIVEFSNEVTGDINFDITFENNGYTWKDSFALSFE